MLKQRFAPVPPHPNCVSSETRPNDSHYISPLKTTRPPEEVRAAIRHELAKLAQLVTAEGDYFHFEFKSKLLRFVDDVELLVDPKGRVVRVRSASRVGRYDFNVNRKRVESLRQLLDGKI